MSTRFCTKGDGFKFLAKFAILPQNANSPFLSSAAWTECVTAPMASASSVLCILVLSIVTHLKVREKMTRCRALECINCNANENYTHYLCIGKRDAFMKGGNEDDGEQPPRFGVVMIIKRAQCPSHQCVPPRPGASPAD